MAEISYVWPISRYRVLPLWHMQRWLSKGKKLSTSAKYAYQWDAFPRAELAEP